MEMEEPDVGQTAFGPEQQIQFYLLELGFQHTGMAFRYLQYLLPKVMAGAQPGPALWAEAAIEYGRCPSNICDSLRYGIQQAYQRDPIQFCTVLDDILFRPPQVREFLWRSVRWLRQYEFVPCGKAGIKAVERTDKQLSDHDGG